MIFDFSNLNRVLEFEKHDTGKHLVVLGWHFECIFLNLLDLILMIRLSSDEMWIVMVNLNFLEIYF